MSSAYFNKLNYTLANEDSTLEMNALPEHVGRVISVAGSGARVLPLFARYPKSLTCVDLSKEQLFLTELRIESCRTFSHTDFLSFWGYPPIICSPQERRELFEKLNLSDDCRSFFKGLMQEVGWQSILYQGRWEQTFLKISKLCQKVLGENALELFAAETMTDHEMFMSQKFAYLRWNLLIFIIGNSAFFNTLLYKGHFPKKNTSGSHRSFYKDAFDRIFATGVPRENYFLQLTLLGKIAFEEGNPIECRPEVFAKIQAGIRGAEVEYQLANVVEFVSAQNHRPADFVSLSDVPSYFDEATARKFLARMNAGLAEDAQVVCRYYLRVIESMNREGFLDVTQNYRTWIDIEKTQMYHVDVFKKNRK